MTPDAISLHCPNCGAPFRGTQEAAAASGDQSCQYCHATLATVSCPACFAAMFEGSVYCPTCGARRARTETARARTAGCAACKGVMREVVVGDVALMECGGCLGMWIDAATFEHICADRAAQSAVLHQWSSAPKPSALPEVRYRPCAACGKMMNRINFGRVSGTVVDVCKGHGTFLDGGELHRIVTFIRQGGLERARQRQIDDLKEEEERLRALQGRQEPHPDAHLDLSGGSWTGVDLLSLLDHLRRN